MGTQAVNYTTPLILRSPNYPPGPYPPNQDCSYDFSGPGGSRLIITANYFDVEGYSIDCEFDYLQIQYNTFPPSKPKKFCGQQFEGLPSVSSSMNIVFHSDDQIQQHGFEFLITAIPPPTTTTKGPTTTTTTFPINKCGTQYVANSVDFSVHWYSPNYPNNYPANIECAYGVLNAVGPAYQIRLTFIFFQTELNRDTLTVVSDTKNDTFSGSKTSGDFKDYPTTNLAAEFTSNGLVQLQGFDILVEIVPSKFICPPGQFQCANSSNCFPLSQFCDGSPNCPNGSDEISRYCKDKQSCGVTQVLPNINVPETRVIGSEAKPGSWPWTVSINLLEDNSFLCTGTLVAEDFVMTSASCVEHVIGNGRVTIYAQIGCYKQDPQSESCQKINIADVSLHPMYVSITKRNNIAMLKLESPAVFNDRVNSACLPDSNDTIKLGQSCVMMGWGPNTQGGNPADVLSQAVMQIVSNSACRATMPLMSDDMFCATGNGTGYCGVYRKPCGGTKGFHKSFKYPWDPKSEVKALSHFYKPACEIGLSHISKLAYEKGLETPGDTGSPLICKRADGKWVAVGVTSVGRQCSGTPTVFEKVSSELNYVFSRLDT